MQLMIGILVLSTMCVEGLGFPQVQPFPQMEMEALKNLYEATSGPNWTIFGVPWNFSGVHNPCAESWEGLDCTCEEIDEEVLPYVLYYYPYYYYDDSTGVWGAPCHVSKLSLGFTHLQGTLPTSLGHLVFLTRLHMEHNNIAGDIPVSFSSLSILTSLILCNNLLSGPIPDFLGNFAEMKWLIVDNNSLTGSIPLSIGNLTRMRNLDLFTNSLTASIPTSLGYLSGIVTIEFQSNSLTGSIPTSLGYLPILLFLYLNYNYLTGTIPASLGQATGMRTLNLFGNLLSGTIPTSIGFLTGIQELDIDSNCLTGSIPTTLGYLTQMLVLILFNNSLTGPIPTSLGYLTDVLELLLYVNCLTGSIPSSLGYLTGIDSFLDFDTNSLTGSIPSSLGFLKWMQYLELFNNQLSGSIPTSLGYCRELINILLNNNLLSGKINVFNSQFPSLSILDLSNNQLTGSILSTVFCNSTLTSVAMVENCFTGTLPSEMCSATSLQVLALDGLHTAPSCQGRFFPSSNMITTYDLPPSQSMRGSIPSCLFSMPNLTTLHLSGNGFTGSIGDIVLTRITLWDLNLAHNILTGSIPHWVQDRPWTSLDLGYNRLSGTLEPSFGTVGTNSSLALNINRLSGNIPLPLKEIRDIDVLGGNLFGCDFSRTTLPVNDPDSTRYQCGSNAMNLSLWVWAVICFGWMILTLSQTQTPILQLFQKTFSFRSVGKEKADLNTMRVVTFIAVGCCFVSLMPLYGALSVYFKTHSYVYTWAVSASFLSGSVAAGLVIMIWAILVAALTVGAVILDHSILKYGVSAWENDNDSGMKTKKTYVELFVQAGYVLANLAVMGGANFVYVILVTTQALDSEIAITAVAIGLGIIKSGWNSVVLPKLYKLWSKSPAVGTMDDLGMNKSGRLVLVSLSLVNNIVLPCIVEALVDPNCFYNVLVQAPVIHASYPLTECIFQIGLSGSCLEYTTVVVDAVYSPPFTYNYQCTSSLLTNYAAVHIYSITFSTFIAPLLTYVVTRSVDNKEDRPDPDKLIIRVVNLIGLAVTFGMVFPPLSIVVLVALFVDTLSAEVKMEQFARSAGNETEAKIGEWMVAMEAMILRSLVSSSWQLILLSASFNALFVFDIVGDEVGWEQALGGLFTVLMMLPVLLWGSYKASYMCYLKKTAAQVDRKVREEGVHEQSSFNGELDVEMVSIGMFNENFASSNPEQSQHVFLSR